MHNLIHIAIVYETSHLTPLRIHSSPRTFSRSESSVLFWRSVHFTLFIKLISSDVAQLSPPYMMCPILTWYYRITFSRDSFYHVSDSCGFFHQSPHNNVIVVEQWTCWTFIPVHPVIPFIPLDRPLDHLFTIKRHGGNHCQRHPWGTQCVDELAATFSIYVRWHSWLVRSHWDECSYSQ